MFVGPLRKSVGSPTATEATRRKKKERNSVLSARNSKISFAASMYFFFRTTVPRLFRSCELH